MRLFVGVELPAALREALAAWAAPVDARRLPAEALHVTLFFLGEREEAPSLDGLAWAGARVRTGSAAWFGTALAVELEDVGGALGRLWSGGFPGWTPDHPSLRPHVTVARVRRRGERPPLPAQPPPRLEAGLEALVLWRSRAGSDPEALARRMPDVSAG